MTEGTFVSLAFWVVSALVVVSALAVVLLPRIVHAALSLVVFFVSTAGIYVLLHAEFIAAAQIIIYAGAITVLVLFAIMLTQGSQTSLSNPNNAQMVIAAVVAVAILGALLPALTSIRSVQAPAPSLNLVNCLAGVQPALATAFDDIPRCLGYLLLTDYLLAFLIIPILLLIAMVGAIVIAKED